MRSNFRHLYADIFWYGVLAGSIVAFLAVYAARLGASSFQVSLLTAIPALVNLLFSLPFGRWMEGRTLVRVSFWSAFWQRIGYFLLIPLPWLFSESLQAWVLVLITLVMYIPGTLLAIGFNATLADVVPPELRSEVVGKRNAIQAFSLVTTSLLCGQLLDLLPFPGNYQVVFTIGALGGALSTYNLYRLTPPDHTPSRIGRPLQDFARPGVSRIIEGTGLSAGLRFLTRSHGQALIRIDLLRGSFGSFMAAYLFLYLSQYFSSPLFPLFLVRGIHLTDGEISLGNAILYGAMLLASLNLKRISTRFGHRHVLVASGLVFFSYPLLLGLATDARLYWVASATAGVIWALISGAILNRLMERVPGNDLPAHMALHNLVMNLGILTGALLSPVAAEWIGLREAILAAAGLRLLGGIFLLIWG